MKKYLVTTAEDPGHFDEVVADAYEIEQGALLFGDEAGLLVQGYAPGYWLTVGPAQ